MQVNVYVYLLYDGVMHFLFHVKLLDINLYYAGNMQV